MWKQRLALAAILASAAVAVTFIQPAPAAAQAAARAAAQKTDLNTASLEQLQELPGVGEATARKIVAGRPYKSVDDLSKAGVPAATIHKIRPHVTVKASPAREEPAAKAGAKTNLNTASSEELQQLPGVGEATAKKIIANRPYKSVDDLSKAGLSKASIDKLRDDVTVRGTREATATPEPARLNLNTASAEELQKLPGVGEATAKKIIANRPYKSVSGLSKAGLSKAATDKFRDQVTVRSKLINLNTASAEQLQKLPGVGEATAKKIIANRPYKSVDELSKAGVPKTEINKIRQQVTVQEEQVNLNTASADELEELPGVGEATARKIIAGRPYKSVDDLAKAGVPKSTIDKIQGRVSVAPESRITESGKEGARIRGTPTGRTAREAPDENVIARQPPAPGMVWVNTETGVYHKEGSRWYGKTKEGKFMTPADAEKAGYREAKNE